MEDIDADGLHDVIVSGEPGIAWYRNLGDSKFAFQETLMKDFQNVEFETGDFNGDGMPDIVFARADLNYLCWSENEGYGNFKPFTVIDSISYYPHDLIICDLDMDGDNDIIVSFIPEDRSSWYENDGEGNFIFSELNAPSHEGTVKGIWDKEGDGDPDLIITNQNHVQWLENDGQGIFTTIHTITEGNDVAFFAVSDLNSDEDDDLILYNISTNELFWIENQPNPLFNLSHTIVSPFSIRTLSCSDLDLDGDQDILTGSYGTNGIMLFENTGNGEFAPGITINGETGVTALVSIDLNEDGVPDFVNLYEFTPRVTWYSNNGNLSFNGPELLTSTTPWPSSPVSVDLDLDGDLDIVFKANKIELDWFQNNGNQFSDEIKCISDSVVGNNGYPCGTDIQLGDLDNDGDPDLTVGGFNNYVLLNDGSGIFDRVQKLELGTEPLDMILEDLNMDGFQDILLSSYSMIQWYKNLGNGQFGPRIVISAFGWYGISVCAGDLNNDGTPDLVYVSEDYDYIAYRYNDGLGNFSEDHFIYPLNFVPLLVRTTDLDLDGDNDIFAILKENYNERLVWYENLGNDNWDDLKVITEGGSSYRPKLIDLDADGDIDVLSTYWLSTDSSLVIWCENIGGGVYADPEIINDNLIRATGVTASDIDADGDLDVISASSGDGKIAWYENLSVVLSSGHHVPAEDQLQVFPCPATDEISIIVTNSEIHLITLWDITGKLLKHLEYPGGVHQTRIDLSQYASGVCILKIHYKGGSSRAEKVIIY